MKRAPQTRPFLVASGAPRRLLSLAMEKGAHLIREQERKCALLKAEETEAAQRLDEKRRALELAQAVLSGMRQHAAAVGDAADARGGADDPEQTRTKQLWALSEDYKRLVSAIANLGNPPMNGEQIAEVGRSVGFSITPKAARNRWRKYVDSNMAKRVGTGVYQLTDAAARAFRSAQAQAAE